MHSGLMRRYGLHHRADDLFIAIDSEARVGYASSDARDAMEEQLRLGIHLPDGEAVPRKLDTIGFFPRGDIALVEVKDKSGDLLRAVR